MEDVVAGTAISPPGPGLFILLDDDGDDGRARGDVAATVIDDVMIVRG